MSDKLAKRAHKARLDTMQRHVLVCTDDDCGGAATAKALRKAIDAHGLRSTVSVARTGCLRICTSGIPPEGHGRD